MGLLSLARAPIVLPLFLSIPLPLSVRTGSVSNEHAPDSVTPLVLNGRLYPFEFLYTLFDRLCATVHRHTPSLHS